MVGVDGGRLRSRGDGDRPGAQEAAWREDRIALLTTAALKRLEADPGPERPARFRSPSSVEERARAIGGVGSLGLTDPLPEPPADIPCPTDPPTQSAPELLARTYVATTHDSEAFGPMVAAEARRRHFPAAARGAFVGDGAAWPWELHRQFFPDVTAVVDALHVLSYVFAAARAAVSEPAPRRARYLGGAEACWQGRVPEVLELRRVLQGQWGRLLVAELEALPAADPREVVAQSVVSWGRNQGRMDDPADRRDGLPTTSSPAESTVKGFRRRVKGPEESWGAAGAEAMLQLRAAVLSEDGRLEQQQQNRPCLPYRNYKTRGPRKAA